MKAILITVGIAFLGLFWVIGAVFGVGEVENVTNGECKWRDIEHVMHRLDVDKSEAIQILDHWRCDGSALSGL